jgi:nitrite reductase (NO-forming)
VDENGVRAASSEPLTREREELGSAGGGVATMTAAQAVSAPVLPRERRHLHMLHGGVVRRVEILRLVFGLVWVIDAYLKWQPSFISGYKGNVAQGAQGQPSWLRPWFRFWRHIVNLDPHLLAYATAAVETLIAAGLILGFARRSIYIGGLLWSVAIWTIPEGFGGSFVAGATDIGTAIMYALVFVVLYGLETLPSATGAWSLDHRIERRLPWWRVVAEPGGRRPVSPATSAA